jgi:hypothetical protein
MDLNMKKNIIQNSADDPDFENKPTVIIMVNR